MARPAGLCGRKWETVPRFAQTLLGTATGHGYCSGEAKRWRRVTDGNPCAPRAMLGTHDDCTSARTSPAVGDVEDSATPGRRPSTLNGARDATSKGN